MRPLIGIPCHFILREGTRLPIYGNNQAYVDAVEAAGGISMLIPFMSEVEELEYVLERLDGILLPGGTDIQPAYYHEEVRVELKPVCTQLDELEFALLHYALNRNMPIFGICRGMQALNVALGGNLYQDIALEYSGSLKHVAGERNRVELVHDVYLEQGSRMAHIADTERFPVNSIHHQALKQLGQGVRIIGRAKDGIVEAIEVDGYRFVMGVQFHPEEIYQQVKSCAKLFQAFVEACKIPLNPTDIELQRGAMY